jgi:MoaA/NifB/PqqE/SkfB family radical SAM enzyme
MHRFRFIHSTISKAKFLYLQAAGMNSGGNVYCGPWLVQIDLTNACNSKCLACWARSPLLHNEDERKEWESWQLPIELVLQVLDELRELGTRRIWYAGGGEPFYYPHIFKVLERTAANGIAPHITTNFTLPSLDDLRHLHLLQVPQLTTSIWAGNAETYIRLHPGRTVEDFQRIRERYLFLAELKHRSRKPYPKIHIYNVIQKGNYRELMELYQFAIDMGVDSFQFQMVDIVPGKTNSLALSPADLKELVEIMERVEHEIHSRQKRGLIQPKLLYASEFKRRVSSPNAPQGKYDQPVIDTLPCYAGWYFSRILANGNVVGCLGTNTKIGSIYQDAFRNIWISSSQAEFRARCRESKNSAYFADRKCLSSCDHREHNVRVNKYLNRIPNSIKKVCFHPGLVNILAQHDWKTKKP